jgi:MFS family permease
MTQIWRMWWPIFAAMALIQLGNGVTGTLISVTSEARGFEPWLKGLVLSAFYAGSAAGAFFAPVAIARSTHVAAVAGFILMAVAATAGYALSDAPVFWIFLRFLAGFGLSGAFATVESWLNLGTKDDRRARVFSLYVMVQLGGLAAGQLFLNARGFGNELLFLIAAVLTLSALVFLRFEAVENPHYEAPKKMGLIRLFERSPFGVSAVVLSGYAWAALMASGPALVELIGLDDFSKSMFMALAIVSGVVAQFPVASLADRMDRRLVLAAMAGVAALSSLIGLFEGAWALMAFALMFGAATFPLYAVGVARVSERLEQSERTAASASMIVFFLLGAIVAPPLLSYAIALFGPAAYFIVLAVPHAGFAIVAALTARSKAPQSS